MKDKWHFDGVEEYTTEASAGVSEPREQIAHTPEPWTVDRFCLHVMAGNKLVAGCGGHQDNFTPDLPEINQANARRIVACVNACAGISTESLEEEGKDALDIADSIKQLERQRDELAEALRRVMKCDKNANILNGARDLRGDIVVLLAKLK